MENQMDESRLYLNKETGKNADVYLDQCFKEIYDWDLTEESKKAIATLIDPYVALYRDNPVPLIGAFDDANYAIHWATQFGPITFASEFEAIKFLQYIESEQPDKSTYTFFANVDGMAWVYGKSIQQVAILSGLQVLRNVASSVLNKPNGEIAN